MSLNITADTPKNKTEHPLVGLVEWFRPGEYKRVEQVLSDLKLLGVKELRTGISLADYNTSEGKEWYKWLIPTLAKEVTLLPCFFNTLSAPGLNSRSSSPLTNTADYANFIDQLITDLGDYFEWVEIWNESNKLGTFDLKLNGQGLKLSEMVGKAASLAKQRGKRTVLGGINPVYPNWLQLLIDQGVMEHFDVVGVQGFPNVSEQVWEGWDKNISQVQAVLNQNNKSAAIWITAAGFSTWQHDEYQQLQEIRNSLKSNVAKVFWHSLQDVDPDLSLVDENYIDSRRNYFGLKTADGSPKLAFRLWAAHSLKGLNKLTCLKREIHFDHSEKYALITGGAGFVGTNLAKRLLESGKKVLVLDNLSRTGVERNLQWLHDQYKGQLQIYVGDIRDLPTLKRVMKGADQVYHFAAQVAVTTSLELPITDFEVNARGIINLLEAIRAQETPPALVFTSTNKVYGGLEDLFFLADGTRYNPSDKNILKNGISELRPLDFHSPYGCSKGAADQYVIDYARTYGLPAVVFRMSCIYGPHQYGNEDQGWVAHFAIRAIENKPISIYGDGKQVRDVLYVDDLVDAFLIAQKNIAALSGQAFNIGGGPENTTSLLELLNLISDFQGSEIPVNFGDWRPGDQHYYVSDIRRFHKATGWYPKYSVQEGMAELYRWLCESRGIEVPASKIVLDKKENEKVVVA